ncbi:MAG: type II toxin-antitoxin system VapC family toxin [Aeromicrobium sp.]|uniref:type II toxin-antitoxin system VapC family toxin n=1 Tax=Aeromicrobium sp. TaxID=1871063 RepID=UPI0039E6FED8
MIVLDTNVLSEPLRPMPEPRVVEWLADHRGEVAITAVTIGELLYGVNRLAPGRWRDSLVSGVASMAAGAGGRVLAYDHGAAAEYARLRAAREARGRVVSVEDTMIAAICLVGGHALATRNARDFDDTGLVLYNPWDGS